MNQAKALLRISELLSRFKVQISLLNANNQFDVNIISENIMIPLLNIVYDLNLININQEERNNFPGIDLIDSKARVGFQITSNKTFSKIANTIDTIKKYKLYERVDSFYIYLLIDKEKIYPQDKIDKFVEGLFNFPQKNIIDVKDLHKKISCLEFKKISQIQVLLEEQFSDSLNKKEERNIEYILEELKTKYFQEEVVIKLASYLDTKKLWVEKKNFLLQREPLTSSATELFTLQKGIDEATNNIIKYDDEISELINKINTEK